MKQLKYITAFFLAIMLATTLGCASTSKHESTGEYMDDSMITAKVKAEIFKNETLKSAEINVETYKGVVQLSGFVKSQTDIYTAIGIANSVKGVTSVKNDMHLK